MAKPGDTVNTPADAIRAHVVAVLSVQLGVDEDDITLESTLVGDLRADSLDIVDIAMALEDEFGIAINDDEFAGLVPGCVEDVIAFVTTLIEKKAVGRR